MDHQLRAIIATLLLSSVSGQYPCNTATVLGFTHPTCDTAGNLLPPAVFANGIQGSIDAAVEYYARTPTSFFSHGIPPYAWATFTSGHLPTSTDIIAGMQDGMGILGYLKYYRRAQSGRGGVNATAALQAAVFLGEYLTKWANTPPRGPWANVTRSTGVNLQWPLEIACQGDLPFGINCIETDRLGLAGYALLEVRMSPSLRSTGLPSCVAREGCWMVLICMPLIFCKPRSPAASSGPERDVESIPGAGTTQCADSCSPPGQAAFPPSVLPAMFNAKWVYAS
jgi:hypothetical protein